VAYHAHALDFYTDQHGISIAIGTGGNEAEPIARGLPLCPQFLSRATEKCHITAAESTFERFLIHESDHQYLAVGVTLHDRGNQAAQFIEVKLGIHSILHEKAKSPLRSMRQRA
jgi:hypothetical protein